MSGTTYSFEPGTIPLDQGRYLLVSGHNLLDVSDDRGIICSFARRFSIPVTVFDLNTGDEYMFIRHKLFSINGITI